MLLLENQGTQPLELAAGKAYAQIIAVKYFHGPVLGARDYGYAFERGTGGFGSTEATARLNQLFADHLEPEDVGAGAPAEGSG